MAATAAMAETATMANTVKIAATATTTATGPERANCDDPLALLKNQGQGTANSDFHDFFLSDTVNCGLKSPMEYSLMST